MINHITLVGRLGKEPALGLTHSQTQVAQISVATTRTYRDSITGEKKEKTQWHRVVAFRHTADFIAKYLHKGDLVCVEGALEYRTYTDKNGVEHNIAEVIADKVNIISSVRQPDNSLLAPQEQSATQSAQPKQAEAKQEALDYSQFLDDVPF